MSELLTLARMAGESGEKAIRDGKLDLTGDAETAQRFQRLLEYAKPDVEEEVSNVIGDVAAHRIGSMARGLARWGREARSTMGDNIREVFGISGFDKIFTIAPTRETRPAS